MTTSAMMPSVLTCFTVPRSWLRALSSITSPPLRCSLQHDRLIVEDRHGVASGSRTMCGEEAVKRRAKHRILRHEDAVPGGGPVDPQGEPCPQDCRWALHLPEDFGDVVEIDLDGESRVGGEGRNQ